MARFIIAFSILFAATGFARPLRAALTPKAYLAAAARSCPTCPPYLPFLKHFTHKSERLKWANIVVQHKRLFLQSPVDDAVARHLGRESARVALGFYKMLAYGKRPANPEFYERFLKDSRVSGSLRTVSALVLYLSTSRPRYAVAAIKLNYGNLKIFEYAKDSNFSIILTTVLGEAEKSPKGTPVASMPATTSLRLGYLDCVKAALFQGVNNKLIARLFALYGRLLANTPELMDWAKQARKLHLSFLDSSFSPGAAPLVAKALAPHGRPLLMMFLRSLARQGLVLDLAEILHKQPSLSDDVHVAVRQVAASSHGKLRQSLEQFLIKAPKLPNGLPPRMPSDPGQIIPHKIYREPQSPAARQTGALPSWVELKKPIVSVSVKSSAKVANARFVLQNDGNQTLQVLRVWTSCSCTSAKVSGKTVPAGGKLTISGKVNLNGLFLPLERYVYLRLRDGDAGGKSATVRLTIKVAESGGQ